jgi:hypothetical protein
MPTPRFFPGRIMSMFKIQHIPRGCPKHSPKPQHGSFLLVLLLSLLALPLLGPLQAQENRIKPSQAEPPRLKATDHSIDIPPTALAQLDQFFRTLQSNNSKLAFLNLFDKTQFKEDSQIIENFVSASQGSIERFGKYDKFTLLEQAAVFLKFPTFPSKAPNSFAGNFFTSLPLVTTGAWPISALTTCANTFRFNQKLAPCPKMFRSKLRNFLSLCKAIAQLKALKTFLPALPSKIPDPMSMPSPSAWIKPSKITEPCVTMNFLMSAPLPQKSLC